MNKLYIEREVVEQALEAAKTAYEEMCNTAAPRNSFTDAVDELDSAIASMSAALSAAAEPVKMCEECLQPSHCRMYGCVQPAVPDAAKPETQGERAELIALLTQWAWADNPITSIERDTFSKAAALLAEGPARVEPLTEEQLQELHHIEEFGLFCDYDEFEQIARAIEAEVLRLNDGGGEVVAWIDEFENVYPLAARRRSPSGVNEHQRNWKPLYAEHQPQQAAPGAVLEGWQLVPVEPTPKMISAAWKHGAGGGWDMEGPEPIYKAMLSAAPRGRNE